MFLKPIDIAPARITGLLKAAEAAARAIPPAFPLSATVAVNPFLGQTGDDLATAAARLARVAGVAITRPRAELAAEVAAGRITDDDLAAALLACASPLKPADLALLKAKLAGTAPEPVALPTVADLAAGHRHRLARGHRPHLRSLGGGAIRPGASAVDTCGRAGPFRLAGLGRA